MGVRFTGLYSNDVNVTMTPNTKIRQRALFPSPDQTLGPTESLGT